MYKSKSTLTNVDKEEASRNLKPYLTIYLSNIPVLTHLSDFKELSD